MNGGFCPSCGRPAAADARFCAACGKELPSAQATADASPTQRAAVADAAETTIFELRPLIVRTLLEAVLSFITVGIAFVCWWIARMGRRYVVTTQRIERRTGVFTRRRESLELFRVEDFEVIEPFFLRMRGAGHIVIWSMDKDDPVLTLEAVPDVQAVYDRLRELTRGERGRNQVRVIESG